jgi:hypothetical protein
MGLAIVTGMNRIVRTTLLVVVAIAIIAVAVVATAIYVISRNACARETILLAKDSGGRSVVYEFEACTTIGTTVDARVDLVSSSGSHKSIFRYSPAEGYIRYRGIQVKGPLLPSATWTSSHSLTISIGTVAAILEQQSEIDNVAVTYMIGENLHVEREWQK